MGTNNTFNWLFVSDNKLADLNFLKHANQLKVVYFRDNPYLGGLEGGSLPSSLKEIAADQKAIADYNFEHLTNLEEIYIFNWPEKKELVSLKQGVKVVYL